MQDMTTPNQEFQVINLSAVEHGCCGASSWLGCSGLGVNFGQTEGEERGAADESREAAATMRAETFAELRDQQLLHVEVECSQFFFYFVPHVLSCLSCW